MKADELLKNACGECTKDHTLAGTKCSRRKDCPVYKLYQLAKDRASRSSWEIPIPQGPPPGII